MKNTEVKTIIGFHKKLITYEIIVITFLYFLGRMIRGEIRLKHFIPFLRRLLFFLSKMHHNKYVKVKRGIKVNLYVPAFPTRAFFQACRKVNEFDKKLPCVTCLVSITSACRYKCPHCYQMHDKGKDVNIEVLIRAVKKLQEKGVAFFNVEGGEPFIVFDKLIKVCEAIDDRSEILINSTGDGMTYPKLVELKKHKNLLGIMFSLHTEEPEKLNKFMGSPNAWDTLVSGITMCHQLGIPVTFNSCVMKEEFYNGTFEKIMEQAKAYNGAILQLIKPKPAGGWLESGTDVFTEEDKGTVINKVNKFNLEKKNKDYPFIACMLMEEGKSLFGCTAGATDRFYINAKGDVQPCEFLNISFGNIKDEDIEIIYDRMREQFNEPGDCMLCEKYSGDIFSLYKKHDLKTLPLSPELSEEIYSNWERGKPSEFYEKVVKI